MEMTFKGFLKGYVRSLTASTTDDLSKLVSMAVTTAPRAGEPLFFLAYKTGRLGRLLDLSHVTWMEEGYVLMADKLSQHRDCLESLLDDDEVPLRYKKVLQAYSWEAKGRARVERMAKSKIRERCLRALDESGESVYNLAKRINVDRSNLSAYLRRGELSRVSLKTARMVEDSLSAL